MDNWPALGSALGWALDGPSFEVRAGCFLLDSTTVERSFNESYHSHSIWHSRPHPPRDFPLHLASLRFFQGCKCLIFRQFPAIPAFPDYLALDSCCNSIIALVNLRDDGALKLCDGGRLVLLLLEFRRLADLLDRQLAHALTIDVKRMQYAANGLLVLSR